MSGSCCLEDATAARGVRGSCSSGLDQLDGEKVLEGCADLEIAVASASVKLPKTEGAAGRGASCNGLCAASNESIVLAVLDLRFDNSDDWRRESCEKREVTVTAEHEEGPMDALLCPVAKDDGEALLVLESDELCLRACSLSVQDASDGENGS